MKCDASVTALTSSVLSLATCTPLHTNGDGLSCRSSQGAPSRLGRRLRTATVCIGFGKEEEEMTKTTYSSKTASVSLDVLQVSLDFRPQLLQVLDDGTFDSLCE